MTITKELEAKVDAGKGTPEENQAVQDFRMKAATRKFGRTSSAADTCKDAADWLKETDEPDDPLFEGLIEVGSMIAIVGPAKAAKSHLTEEAAVCIATGVDFLGHKTKRQRVYVANVEVSAKQYKKRLRNICRGLHIAGEQLRGMLFVDNLRGHEATWSGIMDAAKRHDAQVVIIDPFYQVFKGKETDEGDCQVAIEEMKKFLAEGFTLFVVFHAPKGFSGDRQIVDMVSGSSVLVRFPENVIAILPHASDKLARVVDCSVLRDYVAPDPFSVKFSEGALIPAPDIVPELKSGRVSRTPKSRAAKDAEAVKYENEQRAEMEKALTAYLDERGDNLAGAGEIETHLRKRFAKSKVEDFLKCKKKDGTLLTHAEMRWDASTARWANVGSRHGGKTFINTPERIAAYHAKVSSLPV